ncbi:ATP-binding protein [Bradyrhizobium sp. U87765 SZCCT0131]|uniref:AAA family ATPase n=1 Tax=unclassified Bradyrhizobium TaxID=2631580 RepID=UPI001BAA1585|nr:MULTISPECIES: ATP-binding protein [unclassified Bradyrhizobium]MBR1221359.1 ATP-binding protein [Bradyrhizobium sp. U87765 SZCCT0131]MBR1264718.1 ATP-binding protein [Bradyrhizobium sp. U87765 SZCCT0134]MBR1304376.1 ATP-binding protein [Bradyrhizobium sp. U87765 SZCCT0110]MBR1322767.1 ATP-binding protein [Bradyrhizobium sp. U87765 SZCCT0109]MBR1346305.1 ATP-binding protein [Bradyrhizobium sp. U87765 SZCCT0048]
MFPHDTVLHLLCGKIAAGKSTLAVELGAQPHTVTVAEDDWLSGLYPGEIRTVADYGRCSARLRGVMAPHLAALLRAGLSVVLDFPANTPANRAWMRGIVEEAGVGHRLHYLDVPDEVCRARLRERNARGDHAYTVTDAEFDIITSHFVAPSHDEGFTIMIHRP